MRKLLEAISLLTLVALLWLTYATLYGPNPLTGRIPTHFDIASQPDAWGTPRMRGRYETLCPVGTTTELPAIRSVDHGLKAKERRAPGQC
jgi:hypothetical protein